MKHVLGLDIGGTNSRIALIDVNEGVPSIKKHKTLPTSDIKDVSKLILGFEKNIQSIGIGFAGPIMGNKARLTNAKLSIDVPQIKKKTGAKNIRLLNDFQANGYGLRYLGKKDMLVLNKGVKAKENSVEMVVGPGTGLGKAYILNDKVYPCEGGLTTVGIEDIDEYALFDYIKRKLNNEVYYEDIVSGRGLIDIYDHLEIKSNLELNMTFRKKIKAEPVKKATLIVKFSSQDKLCDMTLRIFTKFYARFVRDSALNIISSKVYLVGGISEAIIPYLKKYFTKEFLKHRTYSDLLQRVNVYVVKRQDIGLIGAGAAAAGLV
ncbi:MAG: ROK family protein [archaeon]